MSSLASVARNYYCQTNTFSATICIVLLKNSRELMAHWAINSVPCVHLELPDKLNDCGKLMEPMSQFFSSIEGLCFCDFDTSGCRFIYLLDGTTKIAHSSQDRKGLNGASVCILKQTCVCLSCSVISS